MENSLFFWEDNVLSLCIVRVNMNKKLRLHLVCYFLHEEKHITNSLYIG